MLKTVVFTSVKNGTRKFALGLRAEEVQTKCLVLIVYIYSFK